MPSRKQRNARLSVNNTPDSYLLDLPPVDLVQPAIQQADLIDMHGTSARVSGDCDTPSPLGPVSPGVVAFDIPEDAAVLPDTGHEEVGHVRSPILARCVHLSVTFISLWVVVPQG